MCVCVYIDIYPRMNALLSFRARNRDAWIRKSWTNEGWALQLRPLIWHRKPVDWSDARSQLKPLKSSASFTKDRSCKAQGITGIAGSTLSQQRMSPWLCPGRHIQIHLQTCSAWRCRIMEGKSSTNQKKHIKYKSKQNSMIYYVYN